MFHIKMLRILFNWIIQRDSIREQRENGEPRPWTRDPILLNYRFCNVRRMDDKVSQWLLQHWYDNSESAHTLLIAAALARLINWPDTLAYITGGRKFTKHHWDPAVIKSALRTWEHAGNKVFTGAYIINGALGGSKITQVVDNVAHIANVDAERPIVLPPSMRTTHANLMECRGIGSFMAGQIVADLRHTKAMPAPRDRHVWAPIGPGSRRGMRRLLGQDPAGSMTQEQFEPALNELIKQVQKNCKKVFEDRQLEAMDIQNCLCEFDKYVRTMNGEGTPRSKYDGQGALL